MNSRRLVCSATKDLLAPVVLLPESFVERARGLLGVHCNNHPPMLFRDCRMIHMFGMRVPLDVIFLNRCDQVVEVIHGVRPWRVGWCWQGVHTLEMPAGFARRLGIIKGRKFDIC